MTPELAIEISRQSLWMMFIIAAPVILGALVMGFLIGIFQSVTQLREQTLSFVPKILAIGGILWIMAPYIVNHLTEYSQVIFILMEEAGL